MWLGIGQLGQMAQYMIVTGERSMVACQVMPSRVWERRVVARCHSLGCVYIATAVLLLLA